MVSAVIRSVKHRRGALLLTGQPRTNIWLSDPPQVFDHGGLRVCGLLWARFQQCASQTKEIICPYVHIFSEGPRHTVLPSRYFCFNLIEGVAD